MELVKEHVLRVIGEWAHLDREFLLRLPLFQASQAYVVSALFGYHVHRMDSRFRLENIASTVEDSQPALASFVGSDHDAAAVVRGGAGASLMQYIASFENEAATAASLEVQLSLARQASALFGELAPLRPNVLEDRKRLLRAVADGEVRAVDVSVGGLRRLVLEAVAFGTLLADAEREAVSVYQFDSSVALSAGPLSDFVEGVLASEHSVGWSSSLRSLGFSLGGGEGIGGGGGGSFPSGGSL